MYALDGLLADVYAATITVSAPAASNDPQTVTVILTVETVNPDFNGDGDVDQEDFGHLQACLTGPGNSQSAAECMDARLDLDDDVDQDDFAILQGCLSGANVPADRHCAD